VNAPQRDEASTYASLDNLFQVGDTRERLMRAMCESIIDQGFAETVVADVVGRARVSKRTFYEEFSDRGDCLLAICAHTTAFARELIESAADPELPWERQVEDAIDAYLGFLMLEPRLTHALLFEIYSLGDRGLAFHREVSERFAEQMVSLARRAREGGAEIRVIGFAMASAAVGAIFQLVQMMADQPPRISIDQARSTALEFVLNSARETK